MDNRQCRRCQEEYPLNCFLSRRDRHGAYGFICRRCRTQAETERQRQIRRVTAKAAKRFLEEEDEENVEECRCSESCADEAVECHCPSFQEVPSSGGELEEEEDEDPDSPGSLYIMENSRIPSELKVGRSRNPFRRARDLATSHNFEMNVMAIYPRAGHLEPAVHRFLASDRVPGHSREFFRVSRKRAFAAVSQAMASFEQ